MGGDILDPAVMGAPGRTLVRLVWIRLFAGSPRQRSVRGSVTPASAFVIAWSFFCVSVLKFSSVEGPVILDVQPTLTQDDLILT